MKIGIISNLYPPFIRGGAEIVAALQAEALKKNWQHVFVVSSRPQYIRRNSNLLPEFDFLDIAADEVNEVQIYRLRPGNIYYYLDDYRYSAPIRFLWHLIDTFNFISYWQIKKILKRDKPDLIITHNLMGLGFLIPHLLRQLKIRHIHVLHDVQLITPSGLIIKNQEKAFSHRFFKAIGYQALMKKLWASPEIILSPSQWLLDTYSQAGFFKNSRQLVLPNPIKNLLKIEKKASTDLHFIYLGQINQAKGVLEMIKAFGQIKNTNIKLHVVGQGQEFGAAQKLAKADKRITMHGWLDHKKLFPLLSQMDVLIMPSLCYENSPTVIYESLSMGLPVLTADIGGAGELINEGQNGWKFPAGDFGVMREKIIKLCASPEMLGSMADNCRQSVQPFLLDNYIMKLLAIINHETKLK